MPGSEDKDETYISHYMRTSQLDRWMEASVQLRLFLKLVFLEVPFRMERKSVRRKMLSHQYLQQRMDSPGLAG